MYFDLEDRTSGEEHIPRGFTRLEISLLTLLAYVLMAIGYYFAPASFFRSPALQPDALLAQQEPIRFVQMMPLVDKSRPPVRPADSSDIDRRATTREKAPVPDNPDPVSHGNTPEKTEGAVAPKPQPADPATSSPPAPPNSTPPPPTSLINRSAAESLIAPPRQAANGTVGDSLRNVQKLLQGENFNNPTGGQSDQDPDIQFDSKGADFGPWLRRFIAQVKRNWFVPETAGLLSGHVVIQFNVQRNGAITELRIVQPSGVTSFNTAALGALRLSNPTMDLPKEFPDDKAFFTVTFHYNETIKDPH
jgi:TonB family protein